MSENIGQRLLVVVFFLVGALCLVFTPVLDKLIHPSHPLTQVLALKPGIDMVGGASLLYEIKLPEGSKPPPGGNLAEQMMVSLKRRVDPQGVKNLIWRPQGNNRIEIQMPLSSGTQENAEQRIAIGRQITEAQQALNETNVDAQQVIDAIQQKNGHTRAELPRLADGSKTREALFSELTQIWNGVESARKAQDAAEEARLRNLFQQKLHPKDSADSKAGPIEQTNLSVPDLQAAMEGADRTSQLEALKQKFADFPARLQAIANYVTATDAYAKIRSSIDDVADLKRQLKGAGVLEFHILATDLPQADYQKVADRLRESGPRVQAGDTTRWFEVQKPKDFHYPTQTWHQKSYVLAYITPEQSLDNRPGMKHWALQRAYPTPGNFNETVVGFTFDPQGGAYFGQLTGANINKPMAIMLDNQVISAPTIRAKITESGTIDGGSDGFSPQELDYLISTLDAGSLPAELSPEPISERVVGSTLGADNLRHGLLACILGLVVVAVFLISYYYTAGVVATFAVFLNVLLILGVMAGLQATFTLPSIAGIVLTIGTAVDANVLIFERLREEQHRGLPLRMALRNAYGKAWSAIVDSNMTTAITSFFLIWFGTEEVKGFGITLIIGIIASLFTALFVTRVIFDVLIEKFGVKNLSSLPLTFPRWDKFLKPHIDWMSKAWAFYAFSAVVITIGLVMFVTKARQGQMMDIEFASGTSVQFELTGPMNIEDVRKLINTADPNALPSPSVVSVGRERLVYEVVSPSSDSNKVRDAVLKAMSGHVKVQLPSKFDGSDAEFADAQGKTVLPVPEDAATAAWPVDFKPKDAARYAGGVAVVLDHLNPPISPSVISDRIKQQMLQAQGESREFVVDSPGGPDQPTAQAVVLAVAPDFPYTKDKAQWQAQLAAPMWTVVKSAVDRPAQVQGVKNFDAQVAGDMQRDAFLALFCSIIVIMIYIWFRFGNLKYGTATVIALLHDTLFTIAALGFAHYLWQAPVLKDVLQLEPFRINLTVVAGILTIMGYSMIDTIVVFDRIRENRGKFGHVSRQVINDAINQTLSRTLLTAGTSIVTVAIMYFVGGPGIHGFTFVLLIGILVGTYSSIAIAAPILLYGNQKETFGVRGPVLAAPRAGQLQGTGP